MLLTYEIRKMKCRVRLQLQHLKEINVSICQSSKNLSILGRKLQVNVFLCVIIEGDVIIR